VPDADAEGDPDPDVPCVGEVPELPVLPAVMDVLPGVAELVLLEMPSPPLDLDTAGHVKLNRGDVERFDVMANLASLAGLESLKLYHQTLVFPKIEHPTSSQ